MNLPVKVWRLSYEVPLVTKGESDSATGYHYPGGEPFEADDGSYEYGPPVVRYYVTKKALDRKIAWLANWSDHFELGWDPPAPGRVLSVDEGTIDWARSASGVGT